MISGKTTKVIPPSTLPNACIVFVSLLDVEDKESKKVTDKHACCGVVPPPDSSSVCLFNSADTRHDNGTLANRSFSKDGKLKENQHREKAKQTAGCYFAEASERQAGNILQQSYNTEISLAVEHLGH